MTIRTGRVLLVAAVVSAIGVAVAHVGQQYRTQGTIVITEVGKTGRLPKVGAEKPTRVRVMSAAQVMEIRKSLHVMPSLTQWANVTLDARHTYFPKARLDMCGASIHNATDNYVFMEAKDGLHAEAQVAFNAAKAGDTYLITYYIQTTMQNTLVKVFSSGPNPAATMNLSAGYHQIPVAVVPSTPGSQYVILTLWSDPEQAMYFQRADVQLLNP